MLRHLTDGITAKDGAITKGIAIEALHLLDVNQERW